MKIRSCPICKKPSAPHTENPAAPFCSKRCKLIDLSKWFDESYATHTPLGWMPANPNDPDHP